MNAIDKLRLAVDKCSRTCSVCAGDHHWYPDDKGVECKHCPARISWAIKCKRCGHEFISHFDDCNDEGTMPCAEVTQGDGEEILCDCPSMVVAGDVAPPMTRAVNLRTEAYDIYIGRRGKGKPGYFGNPFSVREHGAAALDKYRDYFQARLLTDPEFKQRIGELRGKVLGCFCKPGPCHGDVIVEYLERNP
jgi:hypothetical protein